MYERTMRSRWKVAAGLGVALWISQTPAPAQMTRDQCVDTNTRAQHLRGEGKLLDARRELRKCADPSCPALVRNDCTKRLDEAENAQPTIAFEVKDASGGDVTAVKVEMDDKPLADTLDGTALPVDPGHHVFTFKVASQAPVTRTLVVTEGVKGRRERVVLGGSGAAAPAPVPAAPADSGPASSETAAVGRPGGGMGALKVFGLVTAGLGVAGIAVGSVFGTQAISAKDQQVSDCGSPATCTAVGHSRAVDDHSTAVTDGTISEIGFIAGGALLVGGAVMFLVGGSSPQPAPAVGMSFTPSAAPGGGGVLVRGEF
jgi:hypothetical protein